VMPPWLLVLRWRQTLLWAAAAAQRAQRQPLMCPSLRRAIEAVGQ
jgi:hypothetical protein